MISWLRKWSAALRSGLGPGTAKAPLICVRSRVAYIVAALGLRSSAMISLFVLRTLIRVTNLISRSLRSTFWMTFVRIRDDGATRNTVRVHALTCGASFKPMNPMLVDFYNDVAVGTFMKIDGNLRPSDKSERTRFTPSTRGGPLPGRCVLMFLVWVGRTMSILRSCFIRIICFSFT